MMKRFGWSIGPLDFLKPGRLAWLECVYADRLEIAEVRRINEEKNKRLEVLDRDAHVDLGQMFAALRWSLAPGPLDFMRSGVLSKKEDTRASRSWCKEMDRVQEEERQRQGAIWRAEREAWEAEKNGQEE